MPGLFMALTESMVALRRATTMAMEQTTYTEGALRGMNRQYWLTMTLMECPGPVSGGHVLRAMRKISYATDPDLPDLEIEKIVPLALNLRDATLRIKAIELLVSHPNLPVFQRAQLTRELIPSTPAA